MNKHRIIFIAISVEVEFVRK